MSCGLKLGRGPTQAVQGIFCQAGPHRATGARKFGDQASELSLRRRGNDRAHGIDLTAEIMGVRNREISPALQLIGRHFDGR